jgi:hypothetical protein
MPKKKKFEKLPDLQAEAEIMGMMIRSGTLKMWHEKGLEAIDLKAGVPQRVRSRKVGAYDETESSKAVYGERLDWSLGAQITLREEGREYAKLALCEGKHMLAAIDAAGGVDIFIRGKNHLIVKRNIVNNPSDNGKIFWAEGGNTLISVSEFRGDLIGMQHIKTILDDLDQPPRHMTRERAWRSSTGLER